MVAGETQPGAAAPNTSVAAAGGSANGSFDSLVARLEEPIEEVGEETDIEPEADEEADEDIENEESDEESDEDTVEDEDEPDDDAEEEDAEDEDDPELDAKQQHGVNRRIDKLTAKRKQAEEDAAAAAYRAEQAEAKAAELEEEKAIAIQATQVGLPPGYANAQQTQMMEDAQELTAALQQLDEWVDSGEEEIEYNGKTYEMPEVRRRQRQVMRDYMRIAPAAESMRKEVWKQALEDMKVGREVRDGKKKVVKSGKKPSKKSRAKVPPAGLPGRSTATRAPVVSSSKRSRGFNAQQLIDQGMDGREALQKAFENI